MSEKSEQVEFLWNVHGYQSTFIQFADAKAGLVIAWNAAQLAYLLNTGAVQLVMGELTSWRLWSFPLMVVAAAILLLGTGMCLSFLTLMPNLLQRKKASRNSASSELIFWESVALIELEEYRRRIVNTEAFSDLVAVHVHELAGVARTKYRRLRIAFMASFVAMAFVVASSIVIQVKAPSTPNQNSTVTAMASDTPHTQGTLVGANPSHYSSALQGI